MKKVNNTHFGFTLPLFLCVLISGCNNTPTKTEVNPTEVEQKTIKKVSSSSNTTDAEYGEVFIEFTDSVHFQKVKEYIEKNGKHDRVSASSVLGDTNLMVDYYTIIKEGWKITKDHHRRIYFSYESNSYGNILLVHDSVVVEPYYIGPKEDIDTLNEIVRPITKLYNLLLEEIRNE